MNNEAKQNRANARVHAGVLIKASPSRAWDYTDLRAALMLRGGKPRKEGRSIVFENSDSTAPWEVTLDFALDAPLAKNEREVDDQQDPGPTWSELIARIPEREGYPFAGIEEAIYRVVEGLKMRGPGRGASIYLGQDPFIHRDVLLTLVAVLRSRGWSVNVRDNLRLSDDGEHFVGVPISEGHIVLEVF